MINLSTNNKVTLTLQSPATDKYYYYTVLDKNNKPIYLGRYYLALGEYKIEIYYNDIVNNYRYTENVLNKGTEVHAVNTISAEFTVNVYSDLNRTNKVGEAPITIFLNTSYPFKDYEAPFATVAEAESTGTKSSICLPYLQGLENVSITDESTELTLYPTYPLALTDKLAYSQILNTGKDIHQILIGNKKLDNTWNYKTYTLVDNTTDFYISQLMQDFGSTLEYSDGIYISTDQWATTTTTGYKLFKVRINDFDMRDQEAYWFMHDWAYTDDYFKAYDQTYGAKYAVVDPATGKDYIEFLSKVPADKLSEYYADLANLRTYGIDVNIQDVNGTINFYQTSAYFRGTETLNDMNILLNQVYGMDEDFLRIKNPFFWFMIVHEDSGMATFDTPYAIYDPILLSRVWGMNETALINSAFDEDSQSFSESGKSATATYESTETYKFMKVANIDTCPAKYYLQWVDRFGGIQCQPFDGKATPGITYNRENITNFLNEKRLSNIGQQAKWEINTNWLDEKYYPFYESIFVSPYLKLYDTKNDKSYNVIVTENEYLEKTFDNQRDLFNLTLNVEETIEKHNVY